QVGPAAIGFRTESYLMREAHNEGELIPKRVERAYVPYQGAIVLKPTPGLHEDVIAFDFKSMYPTLMVAYNISPDTYVDPREKIPKEQTYIAPEVGHRFRKLPQGLYPKVLIKLMQAREEIRQKMREPRTETHEYSLLDARQRAVKLITNATYGYAGWTGARWYLRPVAEAVAAYGRQIITRTIQLAESMGLEVIYGDTDSLFIKMKLDKAEEFQKKIEAELGLEIRPEEVYLRIYFTEAKKRYAGLLHDGSVNIVGLEVARGDWSEVAKKTQEEVLRILLCEKSVEQAVKYVKKRIIELRSGKTSLEDLVIWKTLTKPPEEYEVKAPHVEAARRLIEGGWTVTAGDKVGFVIKKGAGKLYDRAVPYIFASTADIDLTYYEKQQVLPAVLRILEPFKVTEAMLVPD
ncbi:MAG: DNA polymerase domain-containing protein, partial [Candidatus Bathyarchaeia archaeon]